MNQLSRITSEPAAAVASASAGSLCQAVSETTEQQGAQTDQAQEVSPRENQRLRLGRVEVLFGSRWWIVDVVHGLLSIQSSSRSRIQMIRRPRGSRFRLFGNGVEDLEQDFVGIDSLGLRLEIQEHAMSQAGEINAAQVFKAHVESPVQEGADLGRQHQRLHAAGTAAPANVLVGHVGGERPVWMCAQGQADRVVLNVRGDDHVANQALEPQ